MATKKSASSTGKSTAKKTTTTRKASGSERSGSASRRSGSSAPRAEAPKRMSGPQVAQTAQRQLLELTGKEPEGVTGLQRGDEGWKVQVEVVEVRRIPNTTDVLATYEVEMSTDGELASYRRLRRYARGVPGED